jgi:hypothetical protein
MELSEQSLAVKQMLYNSGSMWPSVVVHEHWPVGQRNNFYNKGNNKITELRTILQRESQNS